MSSALPRSPTTCSSTSTSTPTRRVAVSVVRCSTRPSDRRPDGFALWVFQQNDGARRFYERHGLRLVRETDGSGNEERTPDALYEWRPSGARAAR